MGWAAKNKRYKDIQAKIIRGVKDGITFFKAKRAITIRHNAGSK